MLHEREKREIIERDVRILKQYKQAKKKKKSSSYFDIDSEIALMCQKNDSYSDSIYSNGTHSRLYKNTWSFTMFTCLEAQNNVILLILLLVFDKILVHS